MNSNILKAGIWWTVKASVLIILSLVVIFLSSPKAEAATLTGNMITSGGVPAVAFDDGSIVNFESNDIASHFWGSVGSRIAVDGEVRQSTIFSLKSVVAVDGGLVYDNPTPSQGGELIVTPIDRVDGQLIVRHTQPGVDISPRVLYGGYSEVILGGLSAALVTELVDLAHTYGGTVVAEGDLDGLTLYVDHLWVNGTQKK